MKTYKYFLFMDYADGTTENVHVPFASPEEAWDEKENVIKYLKSKNKELPISWSVVES